MIQRPKGTRDILPEETFKWKYVNTQVEKILDKYGFKEIRIPVFEYTELFQRGVGDDTDIVQKEMYTFNDKGGRSITLRPEGTSGVVRAYLENGMYSMPTPSKLWYNLTAYRYENVQKGRQREFNQIGIELLGTQSYLADVEVIVVGSEIFKALNITDVKLAINSIGCPKCREEYNKILKEYLLKHKDNYCGDCNARMERNPMRILDCKEEKCKEINKNAPRSIDYLCEECKIHFENVKKLLNELGYNYTIDTGLVRGLDYYTKTVFEFIDEKQGLTILGGGRYDGLAKEISEQDVPAVGFAIGLERLVNTFDVYNEGKIEQLSPQIFVASIGEIANIYATKLVEQLRSKDIYAEKDICERSLKAQFKYADKTNCKYIITIGDNEIETKKAKLKNMKTGEEKEVTLDVLNIIKEIQ